MAGKNVIIFSDLDGTLLDSGYSFKAAVPALAVIRKHGIPLILCSSKTGAEIIRCRRELNNAHPFISENGGGIFLPRHYFLVPPQAAGLRVRNEGDYTVIQLGADYSDLRRALRELRGEGFDVTGFGDMNSDEVAAVTGLTPDDASRAQERFFDEPFLFKGGAREEEHMKKRIREKGFNLTRGEFFHIMGNSDKGRAVDMIKELFRKQMGEIITVALGDSPNDIEMLQRADYPVVIRKQDGSCSAEVIQEVKGCIRSGGIGPEGWNEEVLTLLRQFGSLLEPSNP